VYRVHQKSRDKTEQTHRGQRLRRRIDAPSAGLKRADTAPEKDYPQRSASTPRITAAKPTDQGTRTANRASIEGSTHLRRHDKLLDADPRLIERAGTLRDSLSSHHTNRMLALSSAHAKGYLLRTRTPGLRHPMRSPKCFDWTLLPGDSSLDSITHDQQSQRALSDTGEAFIKLYNFSDTTSPYI
jgi:hypothetical protein